MASRRFALSSHLNDVCNTAELEVPDRNGLRVPQSSIRVQICVCDVQSGGHSGWGPVTMEGTLHVVLGLEYDERTQRHTVWLKASLP